MFDPVGVMIGFARVYSCNSRLRQKGVCTGSMENNDTIQLPTTTPATTPTSAPAVLETSQGEGTHPTGQHPSARTGERILDLVALLLLVALAAAVFVLAGSGAFTIVTSAGLGLFAAWRARR